MKSDKVFLGQLKSFTRTQRVTIVILSLMILALGITLPLLVRGATLARITPSKDYKIGELSDESIYSPTNFSYIDEVETEKLKEEAEKSVLPQFSFSVTESIKMRNRALDFKKLFLKQGLSEVDGIEFLNKYSLTDNNDLIVRFSVLDESKRRILSMITEECVVNLTNKGIFKDEELRNASKIGRDSVEVDIPSSLIGGDDKVVIVSVYDAPTESTIPYFVVNMLSEVYPTLLSEDVKIISDSVLLLTVPNVVYDKYLTESLIEKAGDVVEPVLITIEKGEPLLERDKLVTEQQLRTIDKLNESLAFSPSILNTIASLFFLTFALIIFISYFVNNILYVYRRPLYTILLLILIICYQILDYFLFTWLIRMGVKNTDPFVPIFFIPLLFSSITNRRSTWFFISVFIATLQCLWPTSTIMTIFYLVLASGVCIAIPDRRKDRISMIYRCLLSIAGVAALTTIFSFMEGFSLVGLGTSLLASAANVLSAFLFLSIILPIFEKVFNIPTSYRLRELSYTDTPSLNRLNQVALGTFNHVKNVSDMAFAAATAIGANAELARVGALYHDIGKAEHPEYFIENQSSKNAHDDISSTLSAAIIKSHVKLGVEKGKEIGLPQEVIDIIGEHHGNDLIKYFYQEAMKNNKTNGTSISEEDFRYTGKIPSTPESAIVMLADCVEAATRTLKNPNHQKYEKFISTIISGKISYNQLNDSGLTITDLAKIKDAFVHQLLGRDHHRISYDEK